MAASRLGTNHEPRAPRASGGAPREFCASLTMRFADSALRALRALLAHSALLAHCAFAHTALRAHCAFAHTAPSRTLRLRAHCASRTVRFAHSALRSFGHSALRSQCASLSMRFAHNPLRSQCATVSISINISISMIIVSHNLKFRSWGCLLAARTGGWGGGGIRGTETLM